MAACTPAEHDAQGFEFPGIADRRTGVVRIDVIDLVRDGVLLPSQPQTAKPTASR
jgi:hypothetical protein